MQLWLLLRLLLRHLVNLLLRFFSLIRPKSHASHHFLSELSVLLVVLRLNSIFNLILALHREFDFSTLFNEKIFSLVAFLMAIK